MTEYSVEKFYGEYALKKEDIIIAVLDSGTNARKVCDLLNKKDEKISELEKENEELKQRIKEETDRVIKLEQYVYTKLCPKSEHYDEKVLSAIINTILGDVE